MEEAGEIRFVAENAESRAQLRVRGEGDSREDVGWTPSENIDGCCASCPDTGLRCSSPSQDRTGVTQEEAKRVLPPLQEGRGLRRQLLFKMEISVKSSSWDCSRCWRVRPWWP